MLLARWRLASLCKVMKSEVPALSEVTSLPLSHPVTAELARLSCAARCPRCFGGPRADHVFARCDTGMQPRAAVLAALQRNTLCYACVPGTRTYELGSEAF